MRGPASAVKTYETVALPYPFNYSVDLRAVILQEKNGGLTSERGKYHNN